MSYDPITIDPHKIAEKAAWHQREANRLRTILESIDSLREFAVDADPGNSNGRGRPAKNNPLVETLREFVRRQSGEFTHAAVKEALGNPDRRDLIADAIQAIESDGLMKTIAKPLGRREGRYQKLEVK